MEDISNNEIDRNAAASANGWLFQVCTSVYLFLSNIKENQKLKVEGAKEDIEIDTDSKKKYIQVKCLYDFNNRKPVCGHYAKALASLKDVKDDNSILMYVSNIQDPFNTKETTFYDFGTNYKYEELTEKAKKKIKDILGTDFKYENLGISIIHFYGDDESKKRFVLRKIEDFLVSINESPSFSQRIYNQLVMNCLHNATDKKKILDKNSFICHMISPLLTGTIEETYLQNLVDDDILIDECNQKYAEYISQLECDYKIFTKITSDYIKFKREKSSNRYEFINSIYQNYLHLIPNKWDDSIRIGVVKILIYKILSKKTILDNVNKEVGL